MKTMINKHEKWLKVFNFFQHICSGNNTFKLLNILLENQIKIHENNKQILFHYYCVTKKGESPYAKFDKSRKYIDIGSIKDDCSNIMFLSLIWCTCLFLVRMI